MLRISEYVGKEFVDSKIRRFCIFKYFIILYFLMWCFSFNYFIVKFREVIYYLVLKFVYFFMFLYKVFLLKEIIIV